MSVYSLEDEEREAVAKIFEALPQAEVMKKLKSTLDEVTERVCDQVLDYMQDEYVLRFNEIVERHARKVVEALLRGENLDTFGLRLREMFRSGEYHAYDGEKVRAAIVRDFAEEIRTAEMHELQAENKRLREQVEWERRLRP